MKITIYELLGLVKDGKAPKKIKYNDIVLEYYGKGLFEYKFAICNDFLNDEVEIIEEDKKIENFYFSVYQDQKLGGRDVVQNLEKKINEIIDEVNKLKEK